MLKEGVTIMKDALVAAQKWSVTRGGFAGCKIGKSLSLELRE